MSADQSREVARRYFQEFHDQRLDGIAEEIIAPHLLDITRTVTERVRTAFPDLRFTIREQVAEEDKVTTVWEARGTHRGEWQSPIGLITATGKQVTWTASTTFRVQDGKIADVIGTHWDHVGILQQMGAAAAEEKRSGA